MTFPLRLFIIWKVNEKLFECYLSQAYKEKIKDNLSLRLPSLHAYTDDRFSLWSFLIPILIGCIVVFTNWILVCKNTRKCFPGKRVMVFSILPGLLFAITGFLLYAFVETESNYYITHSIWHISMAIAVLFLLPSNCKPENSNYNVEVNYATVEHLSMSTSRVNISDQVCLPIS